MDFKIKQKTVYTEIVFTIQYLEVPPFVQAHKSPSVGPICENIVLHEKMKFWAKISHFKDP